ncbi:uncharacterized protein BJ212DRAFT_1480393 [Suillus subaureus]|uniref:Uncharacterized protein n=1 Tax=Suillus subaureus TaxID=48587 RepID=A0A9P7JE80_9AGAM|nr:uncharacterized protein BJ212DRAFT_1480393 [Suillus subaureus]KAG1817165.1 hypothetical protein BJ212DRAFT_1480393 [Suillus subaureus]
MAHRGPKSWMTIEEEVFLREQLPEYNRCWHQKLYGKFWIDTFHQFFKIWPKSTRLHQNIDPAEGDLTPDQKQIVGLAIIKHKEVIKCWFRWQTSTVHLAHSGNSHSVLNLDDTFGGGVVSEGVGPHRKLKWGISSCCEKLSKWKEVTHIMYATEDDAICTEVKQKHTEMLTKWKNDRELFKSGFIMEVDNDAKIQAFDELGSHLDHVFCHLSHKMGGLKFTCIAGGRNPSTGEVVVVDFHLGETDTGAEFSSCYSGFLDVQVAYADFMKEAVAHDDKMWLLVNEEGLTRALTVSKDVDEQTFEDEDMNIGDEQTYEDKDRNIGNDYIPQELLPFIRDFPAGLQGVPHVDLDTGTPATAGEWSDINQLHTKGHALLLEELDASLVQMDEITNTLSVLNVTDYGGDAYFSPPFDIPNEYPAAVSAPGNFWPVQGLDLYDLDYLL